MSERYTHTVERASGYVAGWFTQEQVDSGYVAEFIRDCNANVPGDPARLEVIPEWPTCPHGIAVPCDCTECPGGEATARR